MIERFHFVLNCKNLIQTLYNKKITFKLSEFLKILVFHGYRTLYAGSYILVHRASYPSPDSKLSVSH